MTNNSSSETLQGDGLAGRNGGQAASSNKMNLLINKLIKALNVYMEAPKEKTSAANNVNAYSTLNASMSNTSSVSNKNNIAVAETNKAITPKMQNVAKNAANNIKLNNTKKNNSKINTKINNTNKINVVLNNTKKNSNASLNSIKGGRRTRYNKMRSNLKTRRQK
jgi:hypothetical protein